MLPSQALTAGLALCAPLQFALLDVVDGQECGCSLGTILVGYAASWAEAVAKVKPLVLDQQLVDLTVLIAALDLKGAAKNKVEQIAPLWAAERPCPVDGATHNTPDMLVHLNDDHGWAREEVRDWLAAEGL